MMDTCVVRLDGEYLTRSPNTIWSMEIDSAQVFMNEEAATTAARANIIKGTEFEIVGITFKRIKGDTKSLPYQN